MYESPYQIERSNVDRRNEYDRRQHYDISVVNSLGHDRRQPGSERRKNPELRQGWTRVSKWSSVCLDMLTT